MEQDEESLMAEPAAFNFAFNGAPVPACSGQTVAAALFGGRHSQFSEDEFRTGPRRILRNGDLPGLLGRNRREAQQAGVPVPSRGRTFPSGPSKRPPARSAVETNRLQFRQPARNRRIYL